MNIAATVTTRTDAAVRTLIERWVRLLADERFDDALAMLAPSATWSAELLAKVIRNQGYVEPMENGRTFAVTPIETASGPGPDFEVTWLERPLTTRVGYALYNLPLEGEWSDVTALFDILETPDGAVLALDDVHVM